MDYYRDSVTQKSWELLRDLKRRFPFVLIGGWAVWFYAKQLKSKDIDLVVDLPVLDQLKSTYDLVKNDRLAKYEFRQGELEVDVYVPFFSTPGIAAEEILANARVVEGFRVPTRELLIALKLVAWDARRASAKGRKDFLDIVSLLETGTVDNVSLRKWILVGRLEENASQFREELTHQTAILELHLNAHRLSRRKKHWLEMIS